MNPWIPPSCTLWYCAVTLPTAHITEGGVVTPALVRALSTSPAWAVCSERNLVLRLRLCLACRAKRGHLLWI